MSNGRSNGIGARVAAAFFDNPHLIGVVLVAIGVASAWAWLGIPRLEDPRITNRNPIIITEVPGATAERVDALVTERIEIALQELPEIKNLSSTSRAGVSVIAVELEDAVQRGQNETIFAKIRDRVERVSSEFPPEAAPPLVDDLRGAVAFTLTIGVRSADGHGHSVGILKRIGEDLATRLRTIEGTEIVRLYGEPREQITVLLDRSKSVARGVTAAMIAGQLAQADADGAAGSARGEVGDLPVEVLGELSTIERIGLVPLASTADGATFRLADIALIERGELDPANQKAYVDGHAAVLVAARITDATQIERWRRDAEFILNEVSSVLGDDIELDVIFDQSVYTEERLLELGTNLALGAGLVTLIIAVVMGWRAAIVVGIALPLVSGLVLIATFGEGGAVHQMSIFGMIIALGLLVDNAIVVTDEIAARLARGMERREAVVRSIDHLFLPLLASTATTVLAFAPIALLPGNAGDFVGSIGKSVILAIGASFVLSMTVIAALAGRLVRLRRSDQRRSWLADGVASERVSRLLHRLIRAGLRVPIGMAVLAATPCVIGVAVSGSLGKEFFPPIDRNMFDLRVWLPTGTSIDHTAAVAKEVERTIREDPDVVRVHWVIGASFPPVYYNLVENADRSPHYAQGVVETRSAHSATTMIASLQRQLDETFADARIVVRQFGQGPPVDAPVVFRVYGRDVDEIRRAGDTMRAALQQHQDVLHAFTEMPPGDAKLWFDADEDEVRRAGMTLADVREQLLAALDGVDGGTVLEGVEELPVRVRLNSEVRTSPDALATIDFVSAEGTVVPASAVGDFRLAPELGGVTRYNGLYCNFVKAYTREGALPINVTQEMLSVFGGLDLPRDTHIEVGGDAEQDAIANENLVIFAPVIAILMVASIVLAFRSVTLFMMLAFVGVLSAGLALLATWSIDFPISFNTILGTIGLVGVALNDSIVVLASIRGNPKAADGNLDAVAAETMGCLRHVISTTLTTIGGFLPILLFVGGSFWPSLAIVLAGGVAGATLLAIGFVPPVYVVLRRLKLVRPPRQFHASPVGEVAA